MKKIYLSMVAAFTISAAANAQCGSRYDVDQFGVTPTMSVPYGSNVTSGSTSTYSTLTMDIYQPTGDVATARPLIVWAHGGSFIGGTSTDPDVDSLCHRFTKKGYVCASITYRLGVTSYDSLGFIYALMRAVQDMKAAVRFFYKDKLTTNTYKIDTNNIFIGGSSAGAFMALHYAYLKRSCQVEQYITAHALDSLGGLSGYSGNQCYSENVKGVINLCGALGTYGWLEAGDLPFCSMHGNADNTVNYSRGNVLPTFPIHILVADGSRMLYQQAQAVGVQNNFYTFYGADHVPYAGNTATEIKYMDTTVHFVHDYLLQRMGYSCPITQAANTPYGVATLYSYTNCATNTSLSCSTSGIKTYQANLLQEVYPNPSASTVNIVFTNSNDTHTIQLMDITGKVVKTDLSHGTAYTLEKGALNAGMYFLQVSNTLGQTSVQKIIFN
ncbi:MAG: T9SS type A sorting domain-containing protein [Bacteroidetes bacterium]|nr:T9SS type A sorting domain-containing protein [Bacteroidota bacterium]